MNDAIQKSIDEAINKALNTNTKLSTLFLDARSIAEKSGDNNFLNWIDQELLGYKKSDIVPEYRHVTGKVYGRTTRSNIWISFIGNGSEDSISWIGSIETIESATKHKIMRFPYIPKKKQFDAIADEFELRAQPFYSQQILNETKIKLIDELKMLKDSFVFPQNIIKKTTSSSIRMYVNKCRERISQGDYKGAITTSRSLVESVIKDMYKKITGEDMESKGNLPKDWKELSSLLNLHPDKNSSNDMNQIFTGLNSVIGGISSMRNKLSDSHGHSKTYEVEKHHAILAVNAALTITDFLFDTYEHQIKTRK